MLTTLSRARARALCSNTRQTSFVAQIEQSLRGWLFTGLENISHMAPAAGADKRPGTLVKLSNTLQHK